MKEIRLIRSKFQRRKETVLFSDLETSKKNLNDFLKFIYDNPIIENIISKIPTTNIDWKLWEQSLWNSLDYNLPEEEAEATRMCFDVLEKYKNNLIGISHNFRTSSNSIVEHINKFFEVFIPPLYNFIDEKLQEYEFLITPVDMVDEIKEIVDEECIKNYPEISNSLNNAYKTFSDASNNEEFQNVANSCRTALINFANSIFKEEFLPAEIKGLKKDDAKDKLKYTFRFLYSNKDSKFCEISENFIKITWDFVNVLVHKKNSNRNDSRNCILYTYILISTILSMNSN